MTDQPRPEAYRRRVTKPCEICGRTMTNVLVARITCGSTCRSKRTYWRNRALTDPTAPFILALRRRGWLRTDTKEA